MRLSPAFVLVWMACTGGGTGPDDWQPVSYLDEGALCAETSGADLTVHVAVDDCMSSSCTRAYSGTCTATLDGAVITVTSDIHWEENVSDVPCTDDCGLPEATCSVAGVPDGTYTVVLGSAELEVTVPVTEPCALF